MTTPASSKPLSYLIYTTAQQHYNAANFLMDNSNPNDDGGVVITPFIPSVVLTMTFSLELLFKSMLLIDHDDVFTKADAEAKNIKLKIHDYVRLFKNLDSVLQNDVVDTYNAMHGESVDYRGFVGLLKAIGADAFAKWRYVYEETGVAHLDFLLLRKIIDAVGKTLSTKLEQKSLVA